MNASKIKAIHDMVKRHQDAIQKAGYPIASVKRDIDDDLSKVAANERIGKAEHESDLRK